MCYIEKYDNSKSVHQYYFLKSKTFGNNFLQTTTTRFLVLSMITTTQNGKYNHRYQYNLYASNKFICDCYEFESLSLKLSFLSGKSVTRKFWNGWCCVITEKMKTRY